MDQLGSLFEELELRKRRDVYRQWQCALHLPIRKRQTIKSLERKNRQAFGKVASAMG